MGILRTYEYLLLFITFSSEILQIGILDKKRNFQRSEIVNDYQLIKNELTILIVVVKSSSAFFPFFNFQYSNIS